MNKIFYGTDAKTLQYETDSTDRCHTRINFIQILGASLFKKPVDTNCIMVNLEHETVRYHTTLKEFEKLSLSKFVHLKSTYWKNKKQFHDDLNNVLSFLKQFNNNISDSPVSVNEFSEIDDPNINIQDGPLACYISHLRAMIYGYNNFKDYTIVCEDDLNIVNTSNIEQYLKQIPDDWDIILLNAVPKYRLFTDPWYKFQRIDNLDSPYSTKKSDEVFLFETSCYEPEKRGKVRGVFHSTHFYIINNKCLPFLFKNLYPITDQVDVLMSELVHKLNIYNIPETVYQYNLTTNTQNNLHVLFSSPFYNAQRDAILKIEKYLSFFINKILVANNNRNTILVWDLIYDIIFNYILSDNTIIEYKSDYTETYEIEDFVYSIYQSHEEYALLLDAIGFLITGAKKGINAEMQSQALLNCLLFTIYNFQYHNTLDIKFNKFYKAHAYGSTAHIYRLVEKENIDENTLFNTIIVKQYNPKLRWATNDHDNPRNIFHKEFNILKSIQHLNYSPKLVSVDEENLRLYLEYGGESLYDNFILPTDWQDQINNIFDEFDKNNIFYPEFWLQNILVLNNKITLVDYGLAKFNSNTNNDQNRKLFIDNLTILNSKLSGIKERSTRLRLIRIFFDNLKNQ